MKKVLNLFLIAIILIAGCSSEKETPGAESFSASGFRNLIMAALSGNSSANDSLSGLVDYSLPLPGEINKFEIDSVSLNNGKTYYTALIESPNPYYNRFVVYDSSLNNYIIDKSLNGYLSISIIDTASSPLINIVETFISKDTLKLERLSLYRLNETSVTLCFRIFTKLITPKNEFYQAIDEISPDRIKTSIKSKKPSAINNKGDIFLYNSSVNAYVSNEDVFNKFVSSEVQSFNGKIQKPQITTQESALQSVGFTPGIDTITSAGNTNPRADYTLTLDEEWKELKNVSVSGYLKREFRGTKYLNSNLGASISIISMVPEDSAEIYVGYLLGNKAEGNYTVRFSEKIESHKNYVQFFEYSCGEKKFLMIFETPKYTFERYKTVYGDIINSFEMRC